ncbi:hypothetical protein HPB50_007707 [Hyalomma asiaticum]|uniref:Uncharacterized protein n=1 Tax=Hyalomma asiaticum TaxID=266040 RepID=A0ACB7TGM5_HYAAI|nr:hypothetical protein HPB50_007707 [Hyalomma asiaticum]
MSLYIVGPWNGCPGVYSAYLVGICPSLFLPVSQLFYNMRYYRCILGHRQVSHNTSGMVSTANGYSPLAELSPWCEFLLINFELPEVSPRLPVVECLLRQLVSVASNMQRMHSFRLVVRLRTEHSSIKFVKLCESRVSQGHLQLLNGLQMGCNLGHVNVALLFDHPIDVICSTVTVLDTLETVSVLFSSVVMHALYKILRRCEADTAYLSVPRTCLSAVPACGPRKAAHNLTGTDNGCFLLAELSLWNELLWTNFQLRAVITGRLALARLHRCVVPGISNNQRRHSVAVVYKLRMGNL